MMCSSSCCSGAGRLALPFNRGSTESVGEIRLGWEIRFSTLRYTLEDKYTILNIYGPKLVRRI